MKSKILLMMFFLFSAGISYGQSTQSGHNVPEAAEPQGKTIVFRFVAESDIFYIQWQNNGDKLNELVATIDHYKSAIVNGQVEPKREPVVEPEPVIATIEPALTKG